MPSAKEFVEDYLRKEARLQEAAAIAFPGIAPWYIPTVVLHVHELRTRAYVIVGGLRKGYRTRYTLRHRRNEWSVAVVQRECPVCDLFGPNKNCEDCHGKGWLSA
jgi:hypothetical protein